MIYAFRCGTRLVVVQADHSVEARDILTFAGYRPDAGHEEFEAMGVVMVISPTIDVTTSKETVYVSETR